MRVVGVITRVSGGVVANGGRLDGQNWQSITIEGLRLFVPLELQNGFERGQRVVAQISHSGDKKIVDSGSSKTLAYEPTFELLAVRILDEQAIEAD